VSDGTRRVIDGKGAMNAGLGFRRRRRQSMDVTCRRRIGQPADARLLPGGHRRGRWRKWNIAAGAPRALTRRLTRRRRATAARLRPRRGVCDERRHKRARVSAVPVAGSAGIIVRRYAALHRATVMRRHRDVIAARGEGARRRKPLHGQQYRQDREGLKHPGSSRRSVHGLTTTNGRVYRETTRHAPPMQAKTVSICLGS
jgi:hypothetical protein